MLYARLIVRIKTGQGIKYDITDLTSRCAEEAVLDVLQNTIYTRTLFRDMLRTLYAPRRIRDTPRTVYNLPAILMYYFSFVQNQLTPYIFVSKSQPKSKFAFVYKTVEPLTTLFTPTSDKWVLFQDDIFWYFYWVLLCAYLLLSSSIAPYQHNLGLREAVLKDHNALGVHNKILFLHICLRISPAFYCYIRIRITCHHLRFKVCSMQRDIANNRSTRYTQDEGSEWSSRECTLPNKDRLSSMSDMMLWWCLLSYFLNKCLYMVSRYETCGRVLINNLSLH